MKVLVCGQRDFTDMVYLYRVLDALHAMHKFTAVVHGAARGADSLAQSWAVQRGVSVVPYPANWKKEGKAAGPIRNRKMLETEDPDLVVAFFVNIKESKGTKDMVKISLQAGKTVHVYIPSGALFCIMRKGNLPEGVIETYRNVYNDEIKEKWDEHDSDKTTESAFGISGPTH